MPLPATVSRATASRAVPSRAATSRPASTSAGGRPSSRPLRAGLGGALIGLFLGVDALLATLLLLMLQSSASGSEGGDLAIAGVGHAGWSAADGMEAGLEAGGVAILLACVAAGALAGRALSSRRAAGRRPPVVRA